MLIWGNAARTSGHQGCDVIGSSEDTKAMKNLGLLSGNSSSRALAGGVKSLVIGMMSDRFWRATDEV